MAVTPQITLTATLMDISGNDVGTTSLPSKMRIALVGFGPVLPCVPGTCNIDKPGPFFVPSTNGNINIKLWGNDVIYPQGTWYDIALLDDRNNIVQAGAYQFFGTETVDLSQAGQIVGGQPSLYVDNLTSQIPSTSLTLSHIPTGGILVGFYVNGLWQRPTIDYTVSGNTVTPTTEIRAGSNAYAQYIAPGFAGQLNQPGVLIVDDFTGDIPNNVFTLSASPMSGVLFGGFYANGTWQRPGVDYNLGGSGDRTATFTYTVSRGNLYAVYLAA